VAIWHLPDQYRSLWSNRMQRTTSIVPVDQGFEGR
jgi:hypothetical protein